MESSLSHHHSPLLTISCQDLKKKPKLREKYNVLDEWVLPFEVIPIIDVPEYGNMSAVKVCEDMKIQSQNDTVKLAEAKGAVYLKVGGVDQSDLTGGHVILLMPWSPVPCQGIMRSGHLNLTSAPHSPLRAS